MGFKGIQSNGSERTRQHTTPPQAEEGASSEDRRRVDGRAIVSSERRSPRKTVERPLHSREITESTSNSSQTPVKKRRFRDCAQAFAQVESSMSPEQSLFVKRSLKSLQEINKHHDQIRRVLLNPAITPEEKQSQFLRLSGGIQVHMTEGTGATPPSVVVEESKKMIHLLFEFLDDPHVDNLDLFNNFFHRGDPCFEARRIAAQEYNAKQEIERWERLSPKEKADTSRPPDLETVVDYSPHRTTEAILGQEVVAYMRINSLDPAKDVVSATGFKGYLIGREPNCLGFSAKDGDITLQVIHAFIHEQIEAGTMVK